MRKKRRGIKCCKMLMKALTFVSIKLYGNKHIIYKWISNCLEVYSRNFLAIGNTCIGRLIKYLTEEVIKITARYMVTAPLGLCKRVLDKVD